MNEILLKLKKLNDEHDRLLSAKRLTGVESVISNELKSIIAILNEIVIEISKNKVNHD